METTYLIGCLFHPIPSNSLQPVRHLTTLSSKISSMCFNLILDVSLWNDQKLLLLFSSLPLVKNMPKRVLILFFFVFVKSLATYFCFVICFYLLSF